MGREGMENNEGAVDLSLYEGSVVEENGEYRHTEFGKVTPREKDGVIELFIADGEHDAGTMLLRSNAPYVPSGYNPDGSMTNEVNE